MNIGSEPSQHPSAAQVVPLIPGNEEPNVVADLPPVLRSLSPSDENRSVPASQVPASQRNHLSASVASASGPLNPSSLLARPAQDINLLEIQKEGLRTHLRGGSWYQSVGADRAEALIAHKAKRMLSNHENQPPDLNELYESGLIHKDGLGYAELKVLAVEDPRAAELARKLDASHALHTRIEKDKDPLAFEEIQVLANQDPKSAASILLWYLNTAHEENETVKEVQFLHSILLTCLDKLAASDKALEIQLLEKYSFYLHRVIECNLEKGNAAEFYQPLDAILRLANTKNNDGVLQILLPLLLNFARGSALRVPIQIRTAANALFDACFVKQCENPQFKKFFLSTLVGWIYSQEPNHVIVALQYLALMGNVQFTDKEYEALIRRLNEVSQKGYIACNHVAVALLKGKHLTPMAASKLSEFFASQITKPEVRQQFWGFIKSLMMGPEANEAIRKNFLKILGANSEGFREFIKLVKENCPQDQALAIMLREASSKIYRELNKEYDREFVSCLQRHVKPELKELAITVKNWYAAVLTLTELNPINSEDPITLEEIAPENRIVVSSGHQFDLPALIEYHNTRGYLGRQWGEQVNSKWLINIFTNEPFNYLDRRHILEACSKRNPPLVIENLSENVLLRIRPA